MNRSPILVPALAALSLCLALTAVPQGPVSAQEIWAKVVDATNERPIRDAEVLVLYEWGEIVTAGMTDRNGRVYLRLEQPGGYRLAVDRLGYPANDTLGVHLNPDQTLTVQLRLQPQAIELEGLTVEAEQINWRLEMSGFYNRQRASMGTFVEVEERERRSTYRASDYFRMSRGIQMRGNVPVVTQAQNLRIPFGISAASTTGSRNRTTEEGGEGAQGGETFGSREAEEVCLGVLIVDGIPVGSAAEINTMVSHQDVMAVEVHTNPYSAPPQWRLNFGPNNSSASCGIFAVWTRRGGRGVR